MKVECVREKIEQAVSKAERFTGKNVTLPALSGIFLEAKDQELKIKATNLDLGIEITIPARVNSEGKVLIPGTTFSQFLSHVRGEKNVLLELKKDVLTFSSSLEDVKLKTMPVEDFPVIPKVAADTIISVEAESFAAGMKAVSFAASPSSMKPELSSVYIYGEGDNLVFVGTDSFRLGEKKIKLKDSFDGSFLLPFKNVSELSRTIENLKGKVNLGISKNQISVLSNDTYIISRTVEGSYPDYRQIIPKEPKTEIVCLKDDLEDVLKATAAFTDKFHQITLVAAPSKKHFTVSGRGEDTGELNERVDATVSGENITIGFNHKYISDLFQAINTDSLSVSLNGAGKPAVIRGIGDASYLYVVMPMNR